MNDHNIVGQMVVLKEPNLEEKKRIVAWNKDAEVSRYRELSSEPVELQRVSLGIYDKNSSVLIGDISISSIDSRNKHAEIGLSIGDKNYWGKGYGTDVVKSALKFCFQELDLNKIYLDVWEDNVRGIKCYLKCGFKKDGVFRQHVWKDGKYHNKIIMSILKSEWQ